MVHVVTLSALRTGHTWEKFLTGQPCQLRGIPGQAVGQGGTREWPRGCLHADNVKTGITELVDGLDGVGLRANGADDGGPT